MSKEVIITPAKADSPVAVDCLKEIEQRYPKTIPHLSTSDESTLIVVDKKKATSPNVRTARSEPQTRLIQISCDEVGRVNRPIEDEPYYHGFMTRAESDKLIKKDGEFLVRKTDVGDQVYFVISLRHEGQMHNFLIKKTNKKRLYWVHKYAFKTVGELIQYHHRNREPIAADTYILVRPCFKQEWQLNNEQIETLDKLGEGAFGEVWKGTLQVSPFLPRVGVAVKTLHSGSLSGDERIKFLKEANLMLELNHENVIRFFGVCTTKEPIKIVMELAAGSLLSALQDKINPPTADEKTNFVFGGVKGMAYLESKKIIHRDIAARNCLLGSKSEVKISDFGLSMLGNEYREKKMKNVPLRWLAPETLKKGRYSSKTDVYSFGVLIWEIYSEGKLPYDEYENKVLRKLIVDQKVCLTVTGEISSEMEAIRRRCADYDPEKRPTFEELETILETFSGVILPRPPSTFSRIWGSIRALFGSGRKSQTCS